MVAKIVTGKSIQGILNYNEQKVFEGKATILLASGFATDIGKLDLNQKLYRFNKLNQLNPAAKTNAMHISLNFDPSERLSPEKLQQIAQSYMEQVGFGDQPYLVYQHEDAAHPHLHIATTLIKSDGKRIATHDIGRLVSEPARQQIESEFGLVKAVGRKQDFGQYIRPVIYGEKPTKHAIGSVLLSVIRDYSFTSLPEFNAVLGQFNIRAERGAESSEMFEKGGLLFTVLDGAGQPIGIPIKASAFHNRPTLANLEKLFENGTELRKPLRDDLKKRIDKVILSQSHLSQTKFTSELAKEGIALVQRKSREGVVYGLTFVDHRQKTVFNGSDFGKAYSAKTLGDIWSRTGRTLGIREKVSDLPQGKVKGQDIFNPLGVLLASPAVEQSTYLNKRRKKKTSRGKNQ